MSTVNGMPERTFCAHWVSWLWQAMAARGKGYRQDSLKNRPPKGASRWRGPRRADKVGTTKLERRLLRSAVQA